MITKQTIGNTELKTVTNFPKILLFESYCQALYGNQRYILLLLQKVSEKGFSIRLLCTSQGELPSCAYEQGYDVTVLPPKGVMAEHGGVLLRRGLMRRVFVTAGLFRYTVGLYTWLGNQRPDIIQCNNLRSLLTIGFAARLRGIPVLWYVKGELENKNLAKLGGLLASRIAVNAKELKAPFKSLLSKKKYQQLSVLTHIGMDPVLADHVIDVHAQLVHELTRPFRFSFAGVISYEKGVHVLVEALAHVRQQGAIVELVLIGSAVSEDYELSLRDLCKNLGVEDHVKFMGWKSEALQIVKNSDVFVLPSFTEGAPRSLIEAQAVGVPVISTRVGGVPSIVEHEITGLLVEADNALELARAMIRMVEDSTLRTSLADAGFKKSRQTFTPDAHVSRLISLCEEILISRQ